MSIACPPNRAHADGSVVGGSAESLFPTGAIGEPAGVCALVVHTRLPVATVRISLALSLFDWREKKRKEKNNVKDASREWGT